MSNSQIIAAVTAALQQLLIREVPRRDDVFASMDVSAVPPDRADADLTRPHLNLFLYSAMPNAAWRNQEIPVRTRAGERGHPPLALTLHYMLTAYGPVDSDKGDLGHRAYGAAASALHDHAVFGPDELAGQLATSPALRQVEHVRVTPLPITSDEMSKLWTIFQTSYRFSVGYEVSVVLIESDRPTVAALPVLRRGPQDRGPDAVAAAAPALARALPPANRAAVRLGESLRLEGANLDVANLRLRVTGAHLAQPILLDPRPGATYDALEVRLPPPTDPGARAAWAPGFYRVSALVQRPGMPAFASNEIAFALAPIITVLPLGPAAPSATLAVTCTPQVRQGSGPRALLQEVSLVVGSEQVAPSGWTDPATADDPTTLQFAVSGTTGDVRVIRLRVDGVDSIPIDPASPTVFDPAQTVTFA